MKNSIMYIDDEKENLDGFQLVFWSHYNLLLANNTKEAEILLAENDVKLVITDQKMADETGIEFIARIKHQYPDLLFIVLTAYAEIDIVLDAINTGVYQFIQKPWELKEMKQAITNAIDKYDLQKQNKELLLSLQEKNKELITSNNELLLLARQIRKNKRNSEDNEKLLNVIFKNLPLTMFLINSERQIVKTNKIGLEITGKKEDEVIGLRTGDVLNCINSFNSPKGCGFSEACKNCILNNTILNSLKYRTNYYKVEATLSIKRNEIKTELNVLVSTTFIESTEPMVLVSLDNITDHEEIIALKNE